MRDSGGDEGDEIGPWWSVYPGSVLCEEGGRVSSWEETEEEYCTEVVRRGGVVGLGLGTSRLRCINEDGAPATLTPLPKKKNGRNSKGR